MKEDEMIIEVKNKERSEIVRDSEGGRHTTMTNFIIFFHCLAVQEIHDKIIRFEEFELQMGKERQQLQQMQNLLWIQKLKIGKAGITEGIVNGIHERWRRIELVKIIYNGVQTRTTTKPEPPLIQGWVQEPGFDFNYLVRNSSWKNPISFLQGLGLRKPFRLLPFGFQPKLTNDEMTILRRLGRPLPCLFSLGRNRKHHRLATAILKLWDKCEIAKIAAKKGVQNTNSELMAKELDYTNPMLPVASSATDATGQFSLGLDGKKIEYEGNVLLASIENMQVFSTFGLVLKIEMFDKDGGVQALIQYPSES
ncbi:unnamed protein product [Lactuca saligna]|uniref:CRM domain-containing protein n=1 Tax=Lactuca saligna TaxID=75948 RepID=A0AA35ZDU8_LACSI|nr:unnamed protein product [Lactuca saligna]